MSDNQTGRRLRPLLSGVLLRAQTDERLAALASAGNQQAFSVIFERYRRELGSHAGRIVRGDRADDVVQHAMLAAWSALLAGAGISDLRAWLHRVTHNAALDTISRRGYDDAEIPARSVAPLPTEELAEGRLSAASALAALAALPEGQRRALTLTAIEGRSGHDAALEMGISQSAMRQLVYRARCSLRSAVTAFTPLPLVNWLIAAAESRATPGAISLGAASGGAATIAKIVAAIGVTAAAIGAAHPFPTHHQSSRTGHVHTTTTATITAQSKGSLNALPVSHLPINAQRASATNPTRVLLANEQHPILGQASQLPPGSGNNDGSRSASDSPENGDDGQSGAQQRSGASASPGNPTAQSGASRQTEADQQPSATEAAVAAPSSENGGLQTQQSSQPDSGAFSDQSGPIPSPSVPTG